MTNLLNSFTSEQDSKINLALSRIEKIFRPHLLKKTIDPVLSEELRILLSDFLQRDKSSRQKPGKTNVTILISDIRGFTSLVEEIPSDVVISLLNQYFATMCSIVSRHHGTIDKFMGDSIMVIFDTPETGKKDVLNALICASEMQIAMDDLNTHFKQFDFPELYMGIGINTGMVMAGMIGSEFYWEYTVIGDAVNIASRIEAYSLRGQVLISQKTYDLARQYVKVGDGIEVYVKGKREPVVLYELKRIEHPLRIDLPRRELRKSPRANVNLPFDFQCIKSKSIESKTYQGLVKDMSYNGLKVEIPGELEVLSEIKFSLNFYIFNEKYTDNYAKVLRCREKENGNFLCNLEFTQFGRGAARGIKKFVQHMIQSDAL